MRHCEVTYRPIGAIRSEHSNPLDTPIQPVYAEGCVGQVEVFPEFADGLRDIDSFSHVYLLYHLHQAEPAKLIVRPYLEDVDRGVFATRAPCRPNAIGLSIVRLLRREANVLFVEGVDVLNETPLLDIKPYTAKFDKVETTSNRWQDGISEETAFRKGKRGYIPKPEESFNEVRMDTKAVSGYSATALEHAEHPHHRGMPDQFNAHARITGPCGDTMEFWMTVAGGRVQRASFDTDGCRSSIACGSMAATLAEGSRLESAAAIAQADILMALNGVPPQGEHCALLAASTLRAACDAFHNPDAT